MTVLAKSTCSSLKLPDPAQVQKLGLVIVTSVNVDGFQHTKLLFCPHASIIPFLPSLPFAFIHTHL